MPHAQEHVICTYPCDGDTLDRHYSCRVQGCPCDTSGQDDWCDHEFHGRPHKPCAFKPGETAKLMKAFKDVVDKTSPLMKNKACGYYNKPGDPHNEIVMDPRTWNANIK